MRKHLFIYIEIVIFKTNTRHILQTFLKLKLPSQSVFCRALLAVLSALMSIFPLRQLQGHFTRTPREKRGIHARKGICVWRNQWEKMVSIYSIYTILRNNWIRYEVEEKLSTIRHNTVNIKIQAGYHNGSYRTLINNKPKSVSCSPSCSPERLCS